MGFFFMFSYQIWNSNLNLSVFIALIYPIIIKQNCLKYLMISIVLNLYYLIPFIYLFLNIR